MMKICDPDNATVCEERTVYEALLPLAGARVLELGCGRADKTRAIAGRAASILALEVDAVQLARNQAGNTLAHVTFAHGGAEAIPAADASIDVVLMFKSLHHVPVALMDRALAEIARVLRPGGLAYLSEPVYAGAFNAILSLFHDEKAVREAAFAAVERAVASGRMELVEQRFFRTPISYASFEQFEERILKVTHTDHRLPPELYQKVRAAFMAHMTPQGAFFETPVRVDLLRRPA